MHEQPLCAALRIAQLKNMIHEFVAERAWQQWHNPKNCAASLVSESGELMSLLVWTIDDCQDVVARRFVKLEHESADVLFALLDFCSNAHIDLAHAVRNKMDKLQQKYLAPDGAPAFVNLADTLDDQTCTLAQLSECFTSFVYSRGWQDIEDAKNLSCSLVAESTELLEFFIWIGYERSDAVVDAHRQKIEDEVSDVAFALLSFVRTIGINLEQACVAKIELNRARYPVDQCAGKHVKHSEL